MSVLIGSYLAVRIVKKKAATGNEWRN